MLAAVLAAVALVAAVAAAVGAAGAWVADRTQHPGVGWPQPHPLPQRSRPRTPPWRQFGLRNCTSSDSCRCTPSLLRTAGNLLTVNGGGSLHE